MQDIYFQDLGGIEYGAAWDFQETLMKAGLEVKAKRFKKEEEDSAEDTKHYFLFCEHPHVYTLGKSGDKENLLVNDARMKELDATFYKTNRGGDITYHGPGQIVGYPILDLEKYFTDLGKYMRSLEEVIIRTIAHYGIKGGRLEGATGVWIDEEDVSKARKICAMGVRSSRWITMHGFALNVNTDMRYFDNIVPCGIKDKKVTSIEQELGKKVDFEEVKQLLLKEFSQLFDAKLINKELLHIASK
ncbi:MAG: lipoyl(octanoyl) transferase LipB [Flavipsychrobacter sp.]